MRLTFFALLITACLSGQDIASPDPKKRAKAARDLVEQGSTAIPQIRTLLKDPDQEVREEAVRAIVTIGTQHSLDALIEATRDNDPSIQIRAVDGLVNFYVPGYVASGSQRISAMIRNRFSRENRDVVDAYVSVREDAIQAIGRVVSGGSSMESRANAARAAGILRGKAAVPDLLMALKTKDDAVLFESLIALQKIRDTAAGPRAMFLIRDLNERIQLAAIETMGLLRVKEALPELRKAYQEPRSSKVRRVALSAIAMLGDEGSRPLFVSALSDKDEGVRIAAAEGLGRLSNKSSSAAIQRVYDAENKANARLAQAFALVKLGAHKVSPPEAGQPTPLRFLLNTLNSKQRYGIAEAYLIELARDAEVRNGIYSAIPGATRDEKIGIGRVLAVSGDRYSVQHLESLSKDPDPEVATGSLRALRILRDRL